VNRNRIGTSIREPRIIRVNLIRKVSKNSSIIVLPL
jgi:hypothetical protein